MKNKSFENYYDDIHVDDSLLQQIPIKTSLFKTNSCYFLLSFVICFYFSK